MPQTQDEFYVAAQAADAELQKIKAAMTAEELNAVMMIQAWFKKYYMNAGLKHLGRIMRDGKLA